MPGQIDVIGVRPGRRGPTKPSELPAQPARQVRGRGRLDWFWRRLIGLVERLGGKPGEYVDSEWPINRLVAVLAQAPDHHVGRIGVVAVDEEPCAGRRLLRLGAEPADDFHTTIVPARVHEDLSTQVMVEVHLIPAFGKPGDAFPGGLDPDGLGMATEEGPGPIRVIVQEKDAVAESRGLHHGITLLWAGTRSGCGL